MVEVIRHKGKDHMKLLSHIARIAVLVVGLIASTGFAQTSANGPYYATPSWDQTLPASTRFVVLSNMNNQAVLDRETGLVWHRTPGPAQSLTLAGFECTGSSIGNRFGWRLPTLNELMSLFDPSATSAPGLPAGHPFTGLDAPVDKFWSVTPSRASRLTGDPGFFITIEYFIFQGKFEFTQFHVPPDMSSRSWCVRGGLFPNEQ